MGTVYKAHQSSVNREVALKLIRLDEGLGEQHEFQQRFAQEAALIAKLEHLHILPVHAYGITEDAAYMAMRYLRGGTLAEKLKQASLSLEEIHKLLTQIAGGLAYAHAHGVIHRDLKPSNIMLDDAGNAYLTDFGLAKLTNGGLETTATGNIVGTPAYMSPEQLRGETLDGRTDVYSLGVMLYLMLTGQLPFSVNNTDLITMIYQQLENPPKPPRQIKPEINPAVEAVVLRALHKNRAQRYQTATELAQAFAQAAGQEATNPRLARSRHIRNRRFGAALLLLLALILVIFAVWNTVRPVLNLEPTPWVRLTPQGRVSVNETTPTLEEIAQARDRLGSDGFIAFMPCASDSEFHAGLAREIRDMSRNYNLSLRLYDTNADAYTLITQIEKARADGAAAFIICPLNVNLLMNSLSSLQEANLPLVLMASDMPSYGGVLVGGDNYELGLEPGQFAGQIVRDELGGQAQVIILDFPDRPDIEERADGLEDGLKEFAPEATVVGRYLGATRTNGRTSVERLLRDGVQFNVILSINDAGAIGAIDALQAAEIDPGSVIVVSIDAEVTAIEYIREGLYMRGSLQTSRTDTALGLLNSVIKQLAGSPLPEFVVVPPGEMITLANLPPTATEVPLTAP
jgi:serine/threonine protein kinase